MRGRRARRFVSTEHAQHKDTGAAAGQLRPLAFVIDKEGLADTTFRPLIETAIDKAKPTGVQVIFLVVGSNDHPDQFVPAAAGCPVFYLREKFGEIDLESFRGYIAQQMKAHVGQLYQ